MKYVFLKKDNLPKFIDYLKKNHKVIAPIKKENQFVFAQIDNASQVCLDYIPTILPLKKYLFPQKQKLGSFITGRVSMSEVVTEVEPLVLFGVHTCDIEGLECLSVVFGDTPADPYFEKKRENILIIGYECIKPCDENAVCVSMDTHNPKAGYDIMITDIKDKYIVHINSKEGNEIIKDCNLFDKDIDSDSIRAELSVIRQNKKPKFKKFLRAEFNEFKDIFDKSHNSQVWKDIGKRCVSCGNCTAVCPTCYCFDIYDEVALDMSGGERNRTWDSCQLEEFAMVAGGESFRKERSSRQKHRYYRKFNYPFKKYNKYFCTGCGRCTRTCMAKISLIETVNDLTKEFRNGK